MIIFPKHSNSFNFLYQLEHSICTWEHSCDCEYPTEQDNLVQFYFTHQICPKFRPKFLMYYQPTLWIENPSSQMLHFLIRSQNLARLINHIHYKMKNDPRVTFGLFLFHISEHIQKDTCLYRLTVHTDVHICTSHFIKTHEMDIMTATQDTYNHWLQDLSADIDNYLDLLKKAS